MRSHTALMAGATLVTAVTAYLFQVIGGRTLGAEAFVPISSTWTVFFIVVTVVLLPLEQAVTRKVTLGASPAQALVAFRRPMLIIGVGVVAIGSVVVGSLFEKGFLGQAAFYWIVPVLLLAYMGLSVGRGVIAGNRRFAAYAFVIAAEGATRLIAAAVVGALGLGASWFGVAMILGAIPVLLVRPSRPGTVLPEPPSLDERRPFLGAYVAGQAASQVILAGGPLVVAWLGAPAAVVSMFFVTTTLFRGPLSASYQMMARFLPGLTGMAVRRDQRLVPIARRLAWGGLIGTAAAGAVGALFGPGVVGWLYGEAFTPTSLVAGMAAAGVVAAAVATFLGQILVGGGETRRLATDWWVALGAGVIALLASPGPPAVRVVSAFLVAEVVAAIMVSRSVGLILK